MDISLRRTSLFVAPLCYLVSGFCWQADGLYTIAGGVWLIIGSVFYVFAFISLFELLTEKLPVYATMGRLAAIYGCICGGVAFGLRDIFMNLFSISHAEMMKALAIHPVMANIIFWIGGPAFPLSVLLLGIMLPVKKPVPVWVGILLVAAGVLFPLSRIFRMELLAHLVDGMMLIPLWYIGVQLRPGGAIAGYQVGV